jgi:hypothetical protein
MMCDHRGLAEVLPCAVLSLPISVADLIEYLSKFQSWASYRSPLNYCTPRHFEAV